MSDSVLRDAARLLRAGHPPDVFVGALDDESALALRMALPRNAFVCHRCRKNPAGPSPEDTGRDCCCSECFYDRKTPRGISCHDCPLRVPS